jgi:4-alpha-glucanotransferase
MIPWRLRESGYEAFIASIRRTIAGAGGLRIDHVMGLFRLWWVPGGGTAADGAYIRYPADDLLDIVALESHRAEAIVVGEDLGTVETGVRESLAEHNILSYRLLWFEEDDPAEWPASALSAVTTHDLPTVAGLWTGADADEQRRYSGLTEEQVLSGRDALLSRLRGGVSEGAPAEQAVAAAYQLLATAPSLLVSATLEDAVSEERRPNMPGASDRPNWRIPLAVPLELLPGHRAAESLAKTLLAAVRD